METIDKLNRINELISKEAWFDFEIFDASFAKFSIVGSVDFTYGYQIEIMFENVHHITINENWSSDTSKKIFTLVLGDAKEEFIDNYGLEKGYEIFRIENEDFNPFYIAAKSIEFDDTRVYYYDKSNLVDGERIADWVKKQDEGSNSK